MRGERGGAAVELALLMPVLAALLLGMIEFGRFLDRAVVLEHAASAAAKAAAELGEDDGGDDAAEAVANRVLEGSGIRDSAKVSVSWTDEGDMELVLVKVSVDHHMLSKMFTLPDAITRDAAWPVL